MCIRDSDVDALLDKMAGISFVVNPTRQDAITRGTLSNDDFDGEMDEASYHIESIEEKDCLLYTSGCRTLFPWGDGLDYSMRLHWFEDMDEDENRSYDCLLYTSRCV